jgi:arginine decarboxylase-like protein
MPDSWAIKQLFPIMPIHRLEEKPTQHAVLGDITCDSDGKVDQFIDRRDVKRTLPLHPLQRRATTIWARSWWEPIRKFSATCTICSAIPTRCTCG